MDTFAVKMLNNHLQTKQSRENNMFRLSEHTREQNDTATPDIYLAVKRKRAE
jgi:hypothetical protein